MGEAKRRREVEMQNIEAQFRFNLVMAYFQAKQEFPSHEEIEKQLKFIMTGNSSGLVKAAAVVVG